MITISKRGGLGFWRVGPLGGSVYIAKRAPLSWHAAQARAENVGHAFVTIATLTLWSI